MYFGYQSHKWDLEVCVCKCDGLLGVMWVGRNGALPFNTLLIIVHAIRHISQSPLLVTMGLLPNAQNCGLRMRRECRERFPRHRLQRKPPASDFAYLARGPWKRCQCLNYGVHGPLVLTWLRNIILSPISAVCYEGWNCVNKCLEAKSIEFTETDMGFDYWKIICIA